MSNREFWKFFSGLIASFVGITVLLYVVAQIIGDAPKAQAAGDAKAVAERIKPVGDVTVRGNTVMDVIIPAAQASDDAGKKLFEGTCKTCHGMGIAGAPKFGDKAAWKDRIAQGDDKLYEHAIKGFQGKSGFMPAKGGSTASDADVKAAVDYMVSNSK